MKGLLLCLLGLVSVALASQYDPHVSSENQFFEGWYSRVVAPKDSFGLIFGGFLGHTSFKNPSYLGIIYSDSTKPFAKLQSFEHFPSSSDYKVTVQGQSPSANPDFPSPPEFEVSFGAAGYWRVKGDSATTKVSFPTPSGTIALEAQIDGPAAHWGPNGAGPEGIAGHLPFIGLHWFVHSLSSKIQYKLTLPSGEVREGVGHVHQEKNWGKAFPSAWIWAEATLPEKNVHLAVAGGNAPVGPITVPNAWLIGYRSPSITLNFAPQDLPSIDSSPRACNGSFAITVSSPLISYKLDILIYAKYDSFSILPCPTNKGFEHDSVESFSSVAEVKVLSKSTGAIVEQFTIPFAALEFGGDFMCSRLRAGAAPEEGNDNIVVTAK